MSPDQAEAIIAEARTWIGTPYQHMGNRKGDGGGVDCGMIIIEIMAAVGAFPWFDPRPYARQFHLHRDVEWYLTLLRERGLEKTEPSPGDVAIWKHGRLYSHGGIVTGVIRKGDRVWAEAVHAYAQGQWVMEDPMDRGPFKDKPVKYFDCWSKP